MTRDPYKYFRIEAQQLLEQLGRGVLVLETRAADADLVQRLLRLAHTLKGAARVVRQPEMAELAHVLEDGLARHRDRREPATREDVTALLANLDAMGARLALLGPDQAHVPEAKPSGIRSEEDLRLLWMDVAGVDGLLESITDASARIAGLRPALDMAERSQHLASLLTQQLGTWRATSVGSPAHARATAEELRLAAGTLSRTLLTGIQQIDRELVQMREAAERLRLIPAKAAFAQLERAARDMARAAGLRIRFETRGGDIGLEASVLARVAPALVQLVRNAVAHGIEPSPERTRLGKPADGTVTIEVVRRESRVRFVCRDDGRGIDLKAVHQSAVRKGLLPASAAPPDASVLIDMLLKGGVSTSTDVTELSGRGVGLDVVREAAQGLGGGVHVNTERAVGTAVEITVPSSMTSLDALIVECSDVVAAIPLESVKQAAQWRADELAGRDSVVHEGQVLPLASLTQLLEAGKRASSAMSACAVFVQSDRGRAALTVDRISGRRHIIVRPLPAFAPAHSIVAGTWLDAQGNPQLVLDADQLVMAVQNAPGLPMEALAPVAPLLVIDDSLTTRMLEQSILESAGFEVDLAVSGEQALEKARTRRYGLFLVDVEMPGMDGFSFIEQAAADPAMRDTPAILVTSRGTPEDRERGRKAGAAAHIVKSEFDHNELIATIRRLMVPR